MDVDVTSVQGILSGIPVEARGHFNIVLASVPAHLLPAAVEAFWKATACILPSVRLTTPVNVIFGESPFCVPVQGAEMVFTTKGDAVNMHMEGFIFLDIAKMATYPFDFQVVAVLEELAHEMMNIRDEILVKHVVARLFPEVSTDGNRYFHLHRLGVVAGAAVITEPGPDQR